MRPWSAVPERTKRLLGWIGAACLLLIIPVKAVRWTDQSLVTSTLIGIAPSALGPAGLLFLILSGSGRLSRLTLVQTSVLVAAVALVLEAVQLLPRPGILAKVHFTFDWLDVVATLCSVTVGHFAASALAGRGQ